MVETRSEEDFDFFKNTQKEIVVRSPRRGRRRSIVVPGTHGAIRNFPIGRLNNYNAKMKSIRGPVNLSSDLESINEALSSDKEDELGEADGKKLVFGKDLDESGSVSVNNNSIVKSN